VRACVWSSEDKLYIIMELIEGAALAEHFASLREKRQKFSESRVWNIFMQVTHSSVRVRVLGLGCLSLCSGCWTDDNSSRVCSNEMFR